MKYIVLVFAASLAMSFADRAAAQSTVGEIAREVCRELNKVDLSDTSTPAMVRAMDLIKGLMPRIEHGEVIENYKKKHPDAARLTQEQLEDRIVTDIACLLMRDCPPFIAIAINNGKPMPKPSKTADRMGERLSKLLDKKLKGAAMSQKLVNECTAALIEENRGELTKTYGADFTASFQSDMRSWLLTRCEPYQRWTVGTMIRQFRLLRSFGK